VSQSVYNSPDKCFWTYAEGGSWINTGLLDGVASVGYGFLKCYNLTKDSIYLQYALHAANWLVSIADKPATNQFRWINFTSSSSNMMDKAYYTGWYRGAAGIGLFLLELYEVLSKQDDQKKDPPNESIDIKVYPNPFNTVALIECRLFMSARISLMIYDVRGRLVRHLERDRLYASGDYTLTWDGRNQKGIPVSSGLYFCHLLAKRYGLDTQCVLRKMIRIQ
jgi:hypothetical protein